MPFSSALVTGGAGFIGSHLVDALIARGVSVLVVDDLSTGKRDRVHAAAAFVKRSILHPAFSALVAKCKPDVVFHLAAQPSVALSAKDPAGNAEANVIGTIRVAEAAAAAGVKRIVFSSTGGAIYASGEPPFAETDFAEPLSPYGASKLAAEHYLRVLQGLRGFSCVSLRYANVYGPRQAAGGEGAVIPSFVEQLLSGKPIYISGDGEQTRDFVYVDDVVDANLRAAEASVSGTFNIGTGRGLSVNGLLHALEMAAGVSGAREYGPSRPGDIRFSALDMRKAKRELGWEPKISLEQGLKRTIDSYVPPR